jgi:hypothetical protein
MRRRALHRRYSRSATLPWQGTQYIERRYYDVQPGLAAAALGMRGPHDTSMARARELLSWLESQKKGPNASARHFMEHKIAEVRRLLVMAEKQEGNA